MHDNNRDTAQSRNPEDRESLSLRGGRTTGCGDSLSAGARETRQEEERLGRLTILGIGIPDKVEIQLETSVC